MRVTTQSRPEFLKSELDFIRRHGIWTWEQYRVGAAVRSWRHADLTWHCLARLRVQDLPFTPSPEQVEYALYLMDAWGNESRVSLTDMEPVRRALGDFPGVRARLGTAHRTAPTPFPDAPSEATPRDVAAIMDVWQDYRKVADLACGGTIVAKETSYAGGVCRPGAWYTLTDNGGEINVVKVNSGGVRSVPTTGTRGDLSADLVARMVKAVMAGDEFLHML